MKHDYQTYHNLLRRVKHDYQTYHNLSRRVKHDYQTYHNLSRRVKHDYQTNHKLSRRLPATLFFWIGKSNNGPRQAGVGFAVKSTHIRYMDTLLKGINERVMVIRFRLSGDRHATIISVYAPTMTYPDEEKERLYEHLKTIIRKTARHDKLILLGGFNARVGSDLSAWERVFRHHVVGSENSNGSLHLGMCAAEFQLVITNTLFQQAEKYKTPWMHTWSKYWHLIDYIINRQRDFHDVRKTLAMRCTDCWSDNRMIRNQMCLNVQPMYRCSAKPR